MRGSQVWGGNVSSAACVHPLMARDPEGNLVSPKLRADQQEVDSLYAQLPTHAEEGKQELDRLFASGHERRDAGQTAEARERFVAAYLLARELTFGSGEAEALTLAATCTLELGELPLGVELEEALVVSYGDLEAYGYQ